MLLHPRFRSPNRASMLSPLAATPEGAPQRKKNVTLLPPCDSGASAPVHRPAGGLSPPWLAHLAFAMFFQQVFQNSVAKIPSTDSSHNTGSSLGVTEAAASPTPRPLSFSLMCRRERDDAGMPHVDKSSIPRGPSGFAQAEEAVGGFTLISDPYKLGATRKHETQVSQQVGR